MGTMLSTSMSGALSIIPMNMPTPALQATNTVKRHRTKQVLKIVRNIREVYFSALELAAFIFFSVAFFP